MSLHDTLINLQNSGLAHLVSKSNHLVGAALQIVHVAGFILLLAALILITLRVLGLLLKDQPLTDVTRDASKMALLGLGLATASGVLMFISTATLYAYKWAFQFKVLLFLIAVVLQFTLVRRIVNSAAFSPWIAKGTLLASLSLWLGIAFAGRFIGFT